MAWRLPYWPWLMRIGLSSASRSGIVSWSASKLIATAQRAPSGQAFGFRLRPARARPTMRRHFASGHSQGFACSSLMPALPFRHILACRLLPRTGSSLQGSCHGYRRLHSDQQQRLADLRHFAAIHAELRAQQAGRAEGRALRARFCPVDDQAARLRRQERVLGPRARKLHPDGRAGGGHQRASSSMPRPRC